MVRDAVTALIALLASIAPLVVALSSLDWLLDTLRLPLTHYPYLYVLHAAICLAAWAAIALAFARLTGSLPTALFRTALAAFPVTLVWVFAVRSRSPMVLWAAAVAPLLAAMLAHAMRIMLLRRDTDDAPIVTRDDRGRAAACHALGAIAALYVACTLFNVRPQLHILRDHRLYDLAELWVWAAIVLVVVFCGVLFLLFSQAPGCDPSGPDPDPIECGGAAITLGLLGVTVIGWILTAVSMAHSIGPEILSVVLHLALLGLAVLGWLDLRTLLERWRIRYGGNAQLDAFGCAILVLAGPLLLWAATLLALLGLVSAAFWLSITAPLALAAGVGLAAYYLPDGEAEPLARIAALALGIPLLATILALWRIDDLTPERVRNLTGIAWFSGLLLVPVVAGILKWHGVFDELSGVERTTRNSRIDDGGPGDSMWRE